MICSGEWSRLMAAIVMRCSKDPMSGTQEYRNDNAPIATRDPTNGEEQETLTPLAIGPYGRTNTLNTWSFSLMYTQTN